MDNGYRSYDDYNVDRVVQIRGLLNAGLPTRIVSLVLPCIEQPREIVGDDAEPELRQLLATGRDRMTDVL